MESWSEVPMFGERPEAETCLIRPSAYGFIADGDGRLAVVRTGQGTFLPGGGVEAGETPEDAIEREAREECGLVVRPGGWTVRAIQFVHSVPERVHFEKRSTFMVAALEGSVSAARDDDHELVWDDLETAARSLSPPSHGWAVEQWRRRTRR
jgi:8-oxo-dGTP diphosphatase